MAGAQVVAGLVDGLSGELPSGDRLAGGRPVRSHSSPRVQANHLHGGSRIGATYSVVSALLPGGRGIE